VRLLGNPVAKLPDIYPSEMVETANARWLSNSGLGLTPLKFSRAEIRVAYESLLPGLITHGKEWRTACPIHNGKNPNLAINSESGFAYCHSRCRKGWDLPRFVSALRSTGFEAAMKELSQLLGRNLSHNGNHNQSEAWLKIGSYRYTDESGSLLFEVIRRERGRGADREKTSNADAQPGALAGNRISSIPDASYTTFQVYERQQQSFWWRVRSVPIC
jgi:CHC2-type zinc finger protein